jgi:hypothetical protein
MGNITKDKSNYIDGIYNYLTYAEYQGNIEYEYEYEYEYRVSYRVYIFECYIREKIREYSQRNISCNILTALLSSNDMQMGAFYKKIQQNNKMDNEMNETLIEFWDLINDL